MSHTELLVAGLIVATVMSSLMNLSSAQMRSTRRASSLQTVENTISQDLAWLRGYARVWGLSAGPYALSPSQTGTTSYTVSSALQYQPKSTSCDGNLARDFLAAAAVVSTTPARPFSIAIGTTTLPLPADAKDLTLQRTISTDGVQNNRVRVSYSLSGANAPSLLRNTAILVEASTWCL